MTLHDQQLKARLNRLMSGDLRADDVAKLYVGMRSSSYGRVSFKELADFAAHPDLRNRGPVTDRIRDMRTTFRPLVDRALNPAGPNIDQILARAESNFRMATDEQVARLSGGLGRRKAASVLESAIEKLRKGAGGGSLSATEELLALNFGDRVIWNPALRAQQVFEDFKHVMIKNGLMTAADGGKLDGARALMILHAVTVMHGAAFELGDGMGGVLQAGYNNKDGCLEVTADLRLEGYPKVISLKMAMFWTDLLAKDHIGEMLMDRPGPWDFPIEIQGCKLYPIGNLLALQEIDVGSATVDFP
ncbi:hypothetical protein [Pseudaminobacter soli (ex Li et al. 2025)]|nr:hypothetical protein [Mesorhizobium soli]